MFQPGPPTMRVLAAGHTVLCCKPVDKTRLCVLYAWKESGAKIAQTPFLRPSAKKEVALVRSSRSHGSMCPIFDLLVPSVNMRR